MHKPPTSTTETRPAPATTATATAAAAAAAATTSAATATSATATRHVRGRLSEPSAAERRREHPGWRSHALSDLICTPCDHAC